MSIRLMPQATLAPPEVWRRALRATLRECSYLPDPIARKYMHQYVLDRYRKKSQSLSSNSPKHPLRPSEIRRQNKETLSIERQRTLLRSAKKFASLLRRANEGYQAPLERVLMLAYGRIGSKKYSLFLAFLKEAEEGKALNTNVEVEEALRVSSAVRFGDEWRPPEVLIELLKAQKLSSWVQIAQKRRFKVSDTLKIPELNSWRKPMPEVRQRNMRKRFFNKARFGSLPPLDAAEYYTLKGLVHGTESWKLPVRRTKICQHSKPLTPLETLLSFGPPKGPSHKRFHLGRPHRLTRKFMHRVWQRIYNLVPQQTASATGTTKFSFPTEWGVKPLLMPVKVSDSHGIFDVLEFSRTPRSKG